MSDPAQSTPRRSRFRKLWKPIREILFWGLLLGAVAYRAPDWYRSFQQTGKPAGVLQAKTLEGRDIQIFQPGQGPVALIFWATWCGPCTLELKQVQSAIAEGEIRSDQVLAISLDRDFEALKKVSAERAYSFPVYWDPDQKLAYQFEAGVTPTTVLLTREGKVSSHSQGVSFLGLWRMKRHLRSG